MLRQEVQSSVVPVQIEVVEDVQYWQLHVQEQAWVSTLHAPLLQTSLLAHVSIRVVGCPQLSNQ